MTATASGPSVTAASTTRKVDSSGNVWFAGTKDRFGNQHRRRPVHVAVVGDTIEISIGNELIRSLRVKHDRNREYGVLANPGGRPHATPHDDHVSGRYRGQSVRRVPGLDIRWSSRGVTVCG